QQPEIVVAHHPASPRSISVERIGTGRGFVKTYRRRLRGHGRAPQLRVHDGTRSLRLALRLYAVASVARLHPPARGRRLRGAARRRELEADHRRLRARRTVSAARARIQRTRSAARAHAPRQALENVAHFSASDRPRIRHRDRGSRGAGRRGARRRDSRLVRVGLERVRRSGAGRARLTHRTRNQPFHPATLTPVAVTVTSEYIAFDVEVTMRVTFMPFN